MIVGVVVGPSSTELVGWVLRAGAPLVVAAVAVAIVSILLVAWTGLHDPAATWLLRTTFVGGALFVGSSELWSVATTLFERSLGNAETPGGEERREGGQPAPAGGANTPGDLQGSARRDAPHEAPDEDPPRDVASDAAEGR